MKQMQAWVLLAVLFSGFLSGCGVAPVRVYEVVIDYGISYHERIRNSDFNQIDRMVLKEGEQRFPIEGEGRVACRLELIHFNREVTSGEAEAELRRRGLRPARIEHAIALASQQPNVFMDCREQIVALGSFSELAPGQPVYVSIMGWCNGWVYDPTLVVDQSEDGRWPEDCRFLALRQ